MLSDTQLLLIHFLLIGGNTSVAGNFSVPSSEFEVAHHHVAVCSLCIDIAPWWPHCPTGPSIPVLHLPNITQSGWSALVVGDPRPPPPPPRS